MDIFNQKTVAIATKKKHYNPIVINGDGLELIAYINFDDIADTGCWNEIQRLKLINTDMLF